MAHWKSIFNEVLETTKNLIDLIFNFFFLNEHDSVKEAREKTKNHVK